VAKQILGAVPTIPFQSEAPQNEQSPVLFHRAFLSADKKTRLKAGFFFL